MIARVVASALALTFVPLVAYAQFDFSNPDGVIIKSQAYITMSPEHPAPGDTVHLSVVSPQNDLGGAHITWTADGKTIASGNGVTTADVVAGHIGTRMSIGVTVDTGSETLSATSAIAPTQIDLLFDSDSYTPPFYHGRALPTAGTTLRLQALPHFERTSGALVAASDITYTWRRNGTVLGSVSGRGKSSVTIAAPTLFESDVISVDAVSSDNTLSGSASVVIPALEPQLLLYEDHPLYGVLYHMALGATTFISDTEMSFVAAPYFAPTQSPNDPSLIYAWRVNNSAVTPSATAPSRITINADHSNGQALISLNLTHATNFFMSSSGSWSVNFSQSAQGSLFKSP